MHENNLEPKILSNLEIAEAKEAHLNRFWNDENFKIELDGQKLTLAECYDRAIIEADKIFAETKKVNQEQIPAGKYVLYINSTIEGLVGNKDIKYIDKDRLSKMYRAETGSGEISFDGFQDKNMGRCLGFEQGDARFKAVNAFTEKMPEDLTNCVGIVFSGSETDITDETHLERIKMTERARDLIKNSEDLKIPKLGICFGGQLLASEAGAKINWIFDKEGHKSRITGMNEISQTDMSKDSSLHLDFPKKDFYVAKNHGQKIDRDSIPSNGEILAEGADGSVEMVYFKDSNTLCTQFHPELDVTRLDIAESISNSKKEPTELFKKNPDEIRAVLFPNFLKMAGEYVRNTK